MAAINMNCDLSGRELSLYNPGLRTPRGVLDLGSDIATLQAEEVLFIISLRLKLMTLGLGLPSAPALCAICTAEIKGSKIILLRKLGVDLSVASRILGHSDVSITAKHYNMVSNDEEQAAILLLEKAIFNNPDE